MAKGDVSAGIEASQQWHGLPLCPMPCEEEPVCCQTEGTEVPCLEACWLQG